ncbi:unnamed protein product [Urochloa humidicola]
MEDMDMGGMRHHLMCPISLQPMQGPVTAPTGITYDRRAIERWLAAGHATCPVTGQPLALADLTPNHTLRRLIHSWRPRSTPDNPVDDAEQYRPDGLAMIALLSTDSCPPVDALREAAEAASRSDVARRNMLDAGVLPRVLRLAVSVSRAKATTCLGDREAVVEACLDLARALAVSGDEHVADNHAHDLVGAVTDVLVSLESGGAARAGARASAARLLDAVTEACGAPVLERLRPELFGAVTAVVRDRVSPGATRAALRVLLHACPVGRNRALAVEAGAAHEAIELELDAPPSAGGGGGGGGRRAAELAMALLAELCACADGRAAVAAHPAGVAVVARRLLRVSAAADACAVRVLAAVGGRAASPEVLREMARVGAVGKLCCVLQADCDGGVKEAARAVLRLHSGVWSASPCVSAYLLSRYL